VFTVLYGFLALCPQAMQRHRRRLSERASNQARLIFGSWLAMALECQLGADIVVPTSSSESNLIQLAVITLVGSFLNLFPGREMDAEQRREEDIAHRAAARGSPSPTGLISQP
jgi:uncharacterized membrane protein